MTHDIKTVLTIAGSDSSGGAGIQADLKTFNSLGVYGMSVLTSLTAQNTTGVQEIYNIDAEFVGKQIDSVMEDIQIDVWKTGMLANEEIINVVIDKLKFCNQDLLVVDPVMVARSGDELTQHNAQNVIISKLVPLAYILTPNIYEAEIIAKTKIETIEDVYIAAKKIYQKGAKNVVIKGGSLEAYAESIDLLYNGKDFIKFSTRRIKSENTHGSGCTFASAIAAELAKGNVVKQAVYIAKAYVSELIDRAKSYKIGHGHGPLHHFVKMELNQKILNKIKVE